MWSERNRRRLCQKRHTHIGLGEVHAMNFDLACAVAGLATATELSPGGTESC
jgi:hypothetical protein